MIIDHALSGAATRTFSAGNSTVEVVEVIPAMESNTRHQSNLRPPSPSRRRFILGLGTAAVTFAALRDVPARAAEAQSLKTIRQTGRAFGTTTSITALHADPQAAQRAVAAAFTELQQIDELMSLYRPDSQICRLNRTGLLEHPHPCIVDILRQCRSMSEASDGAFDITVQPLWEAYAAAKKTHTLPSPDALAKLISLVDYRKIDISPDRVTLAPGMSITLNAIAQGYAADRVAAVLRKHDVRHALFDTGELGAIGRRADGQPWTVGIQHPRVKDAYIGIARLDDRFMATSGDYATSFTDDHAYNHIFEPRTGRSPQVFSSVTIVANSGALADALSTTVFVLGQAKGLKLVENTPSAEALLVLKDNQVLKTASFPSA